MSAQTLRSTITPIQTALAFTDEDLAANRQGRLGPSQEARLRRKRRIITLNAVAIICILIAALVWFYLKIDPIFVIEVFVIPLVILQALYQLRPLHQDIASGIVETVEGPLRREVHMGQRWREQLRNYERGFLGDMWIYEIVVDYEHFYVSRAVYMSVVKETDTIVYYAPHSRIIVAIEQVPL